MILKYLLLPALFTSLSFADVYYSKAEPLHLDKLTSNVSGRVIDVNESIEGGIASKEVVIHIDDALDSKELEHLKIQEKLLTQRLTQYEEVAKRRTRHYKNVNAIKSKSQTEKDTAFYAHVTALQSLASTRIELGQVRDRLFAKKQTLADKQIILEGLYLYDLLVSKGEYVTLGTPLALVADISKVKLKFFISAEDALEIHNRDLYIDDKKSELKFSQVWKMSDSEHISSYEAVLILEAKTQLSQLVKVELKEKL